MPTRIALVGRSVRHEFDVRRVRIVRRVILMALDWAIVLATIIPWAVILTWLLARHE